MKQILNTLFVMTQGAPPLDRMNRLLSFLYTLLLHDCISAAEGSCSTRCYAPYFERRRAWASSRPIRCSVGRCPSVPRAQLTSSKPGRASARQ